MKIAALDNLSVHPHARKDALQRFEKSLDRPVRAGDKVVTLYLVDTSDERGISAEHGTVSKSGPAPAGSRCG